MKRQRFARLLLVAGLLAIAWIGRQSLPDGIVSSPSPEATAAPSEATAAPSEAAAAGSGSAAIDNQALLRAIHERRSGVMVGLRGPVVHLLPDDRRGSRHQRFLVDVGAEEAVLVSHNIDLAPRIDTLRKGDPVEALGQFEWNEKGGVLHWTHHDPDGRRRGGWIRHGGRTYR